MVIQVNMENYDFIYDALRERFETCKERGRASSEDEILFDRFAECIACGGVRKGDTASSIVDNRCINGYSGDYMDYVRERRGDCEEFRNLLEKDVEDRNEEELEMVEIDIEENGGDYDRSNFYFHI